MLYKSSIKNNKVTSGAVTSPRQGNAGIYSEAFIKEKRISRQMTIRMIEDRDIEKVYNLEREIEGEYAASLELLTDRFAMYPEGFRVVEVKNDIVGYIESCRWNIDDFNTFREISDFPKQFEPEGRYLYIIFLAVAKEYRQNGLGSSLVNSIIDLAYQEGIEKVQLVSKENLVGYYGRLRFKVSKYLHKFLDDIDGVLMDRKI